MSNLNSHYEISIWEDVVGDNNTFSEARICVIGSDEMTSQMRALDPVLTRTINGQKKLTFKMYRQYVDNISGEKITNIFTDYLVSEAKVKLYYEDSWYDFYVKNIQENSSTYLYTYQLEDAIVQELSKNGYSVSLSAEEMNNLGTAKKLAEDVMLDSGWTIGESDVLVEQVEEHLVYLQVAYKEGQEPYTATRLRDQVDFTKGVEPYGSPVQLTNGAVLLGFYSCCKNKPHRFQFIYLDNCDYDKDLVQTDENQIITEKDCQYYIDINQPQTGYVSVSDFYLPEGINIVNKGSGNIFDTTDTTISNWFKGKRYGFAIASEYVPLVERYCNKYKKNNEEYYGYLQSDYVSTSLIQNIITNDKFEGTDGWVGSYGYKDDKPANNLKSQYGATVSCVRGKLDGNGFHSALDDLTNGSYVTDRYKNFLQMDFKSTKDDNSKSIVINSGFYENRQAIGNVQPGEEWILEAIIRNDEGTNCKEQFSFELWEVAYSSVTGGYELRTLWGSTNNNWDNLKNTSTLVFKDNIESLSSTDFTSKDIRLVITAPSAATYYLEKISLYKKVVNEDGYILKPGEAKDEIEGQEVTLKGFVDNKYVFFKEEQVKGNNPVTSADDLIKEVVTENNIDYGMYIPQYNTGAEKIRTVKAAESNYFNILQSIAETFECWLKFEIKREDPNNPGRITEKIINLKGYAGDTNYAGFRYGVNLKDIQRTYESKQLTTKLIVKQNNNELAKNGFCTIARAGSNPTGESYIYDFQYFHKTKMLDSDQFVANMYYEVNPYNGTEAAGEDVVDANGNAGTADNTNLQNYFNRIKKINNQIEPINDELVNLTLDLTKLKAEQTVQEGYKQAAIDSINKEEERFYSQVGLYPKDISSGTIKNVTTTLETTKIGGFDYTPKISSKTLQTNKQTANIMFNVDFGNSKTNVSYGFSTYRCSYTTSGTSYTFSVDSPNSLHSSFIIVPSSNGESQSINGINYYILKNNYRYRFRCKIKVNSYTLEKIGILAECFSNTLIRWYKIQNNEWEFLQETNSSALEFKEAINSGSTVYGLEVYGSYIGGDFVNSPYLYIKPNTLLIKPFNITVSEHEFTVCDEQVASYDRSFSIKPAFNIVLNNNVSINRTAKINLTLPAYSLLATHEYQLALYESTSTSEKCLNEYLTYDSKLQDAQTALASIEQSIATIDAQIQTQQTARQKLINQKKALNQLFYKTYSRFIQEGTWMSEEYVDDDKYYNDAASVLYESCYPKVAYTINVLALRHLPGYEHFTYKLGDTTYAEDPDFFGEDLRTEVTITEISEHLDNPAKNTIKVQNFKNHFQDLFQRINATVQQTQYNTGAYKKAVELAEASVKIKGKFVTDGLSEMSNSLSVAGQTTVVQDASGITLTDENTQNQMRLIGGAILMSVQDKETGARSWKTGLTPNGISATLITAGNINAGEISIMNANDPTFKWNSFGISAFDVDWINDMPNGKVNPYKFVRFDKHGIYGIDSANKIGNTSINGEDWVPSNGIEDIVKYATFALTWEGLKVVGNDDVVVKIGKNNGNVLSITKKSKDLLKVTNDGTLEVTGTIKANTGYLGSEEFGWLINGNALSYGVIGTDNSFFLSPSGSYAANNPITIGPTNNQSTQYTIWAMTIGNTFGVTTNGTLYAKNAVIEGDIYSKKGTIGGWEITENAISKSSVGLSSSGDYALWAGSSTVNEYTTPFFVKRNGYLKATTGKIGGWTLGATFLESYGQKLEETDRYYTKSFGLQTGSTGNWAIAIGNMEPNDWGNADFRVNHDGKLFCKYGQLGPNLIIEPSDAGVFTLLGNENIVNYKSPNQTPSTSLQGCFIGFSETTGYIALRSVNYGCHITASGIQLISKATSNTSVIGLTNSNNSNYIKIKPDNYEIASFSAQEGLWLKPGKDTNSRNVVSFNGHAGIQDHSSSSLQRVDVVGSWYVSGTWQFGANGPTYTSDKNKKNNIKSLERNHELLFDSLKPVTYKYNEGTSDRFHIGYIAQDVGEAITKAGLTTQDFAGLCIYGKDTEEELWTLRYEEFIALNTHQIQLLKPRMTEAENKIQTLENEIASLKSKLENLKNSQNSVII